MFKFVVCSLMLLLISFECGARDLPSFFPTCCVKDPELGNCILKAAKILQPRVAKGIPEISLPPFNPVVVPKFSLHQKTDVLNYNATLTNFTIRGMEFYDIREIHFDPKTLRLHGTVQFPPISLSTQYEIIGRIVDFGIAGSGDALVDFEPVKGTFEFLGKLVKRIGTNDIEQEYYSPTEVNTRIKLTDLHAHLTGLFGDNEGLGRLTNEMINQNSKAIATAAAPALAEVLDQNLLVFMKHFTSKVPYNKIFPC